MRRSAPIAVSLAAVLAGCARVNDVVIDASGLAEEQPGVVLRVAVLERGEALQEGALDLSAETSLRFEDLLVAGRNYGVLAYADLDGDEECAIDVDLPWAFVWEAGVNQDLVWSPTVGALQDPEACTWFSGLSDDLFDTADSGG